VARDDSVTSSTISWPESVEGDEYNNSND